jgi:hypothetical protein
VIVSLVLLIAGVVLVAAGLALALAPWASLLWLGAVFVVAGLFYDSEG